MREEDYQGILTELGAMRPVLSGIDPSQRHQSHLSLGTMFPPNTDGRCGCGCGKELSGRRTRWASDRCSKNAFRVYAIHSGYSDIIRFWVRIRDRGICAKCNEKNPWEADHIIPVRLGGGGCGLDGFQTLCGDCHKAKTAGMLKAIATVKRYERQRGQEVMAL